MRERTEELKSKLTSALIYPVVLFLTAIGAVIVLLTVVVWAVLAIGFSWWLLEFNSFASTYASLSGLFAAMFFLYLAALVLILGGEVNRVIDLLTTQKVLPEKPDLRD